MSTFASLNLIAPIQRAIQEENYTTPTPIQLRTIPDALQGRDILGCAQTGTGKTAAFALPILNHLSERNRKLVPNRPQALVLAPTRELAIQIAQNCACYGRHLKVRQAVIYGGVGQGSQVKSLDQGVHLVIATPGRLLDLMQQGYLKLDQLQLFVLDEADRMMDMGFLPDLKRIIAALPAKRQSLFFSATLPPEIVRLASKLLIDPVSVNVTPPSSTVELIDQQVMFVERNQKREVLLKLLNSGAVGQTLVFTQTKRGANLLAQQLTRAGVESAAIHGNKSQNARQRALDEFRRGKIHVLVATDLAARGIDVEGITHVINYELPHEPESYVHRIGRTGRAGETGIAISLCDSRERADLMAIQRLIGKKIPVATTIAVPADAKPRSVAEKRTTAPQVDDFGDGLYPAGQEAAVTERPRRTRADGNRPQRAQASGTDAPQKTVGQAAGAGGSAERVNSSRRAYGRRPNRQATEEYKASGGRKSLPAEDRPQNTNRNESSEQPARRRSRRPRRKLADAGRNS